MESILTDLIYKACLEVQDKHYVNFNLKETSIIIEKPKLASHGDFSCGIAFKLAGQLKKSPLEIAKLIYETIAKQTIGKLLEGISVTSPGYLNFTVSKLYLYQILKEILEQPNNYGRGQNQSSVLIEYVSANPTGPLHIGHARNAVFGSCLANLLKYAGYQVEEEFYINDTGQQIIKLGQSLLVCYKRQLGLSNYNYAIDSYPEWLLLEPIQQIIEEHDQELVNLTDIEISDKLATLFMDITINNQKAELNSLKIEFNTWYSEKTLHDSGKIKDMLKLLAANNQTYESEGAIWLKSKELGDERDRVLVKSNNHLTYLATDATYHLDKFKRGFDYIINIWGSDHHGQVPSLKAILKALNCDINKFSVILTQMVNLSKNGEIVRMSKRMGTVITLKEVIDEVGADATRYFLIESSPNNAVNFDLELAKKASSENPVFYIQYAYARMSSILRKATNLSPDFDFFNLPSEQIYLKCNKKNTLFAHLFDDNGENYTLHKKIILKLASFKNLITESSQSQQPHKIAHYAYDLACDLQKFYETAKVLNIDDLNQSLDRLLFILAVRTVLANCLIILGLNTPEKM